MVIQIVPPKVVLSCELLATVGRVATPDSITGVFRKVSIKVFFPKEPFPTEAA
jgi:hypothetical protein